jgi:hypothetical protein
MPHREIGHPESSRDLHRRMALGGLCLLVGMLGLSLVLFEDMGDALTRNTIRLALAWYAVAVACMFTMTSDDWRSTTATGRQVRWCWTWAVVCFLVHVGMAFQFYHHWSHAAAFERTRQVSGFGEGIYVSYAFTGLWTADAAWWWLWPLGYARRPAWIHRGWHIFMAFVVFNGMVVFEVGWIRWAGVIMFTVLAMVWLLTNSARPSLTSER